MSNLILAGQILTAGQGQGQLSQYYGYADVAQTTVTATGLSTLSSKYVIPAGEPYAGAAWELSCAGIGAIGTVQHNLQFAMEIQGTAIVAGLPPVAAAALSIGQSFSYALRFLLVSADGASQWWGSLQGSLVETGTPLQPGTAGAQSVALAAATTVAVSAPTTSPVSMAVDAAWGSGPDGCTIKNVLTTFRKIALWGGGCCTSSEPTTCPAAGTPGGPAPDPTYPNSRCSAPSWAPGTSTTATRPAAGAWAGTPLTERRGATGTTRRQETKAGPGEMADRLAASSGHLAYRHGPGPDHHPDRREGPVINADRRRAGAHGARGGHAREHRAFRALGSAWWRRAVLTAVAAAAVLAIAAWGWH